MGKKTEKQQQKSDSKPVLTPSYSVGKTDIASSLSQNLPQNNLDVVVAVGANERTPVLIKADLPEKLTSPLPREKSIPIFPQSKSKHLWQQKIIPFFKDKWNLSFLVILFLGLLIRLKYIWQESIWNDSAVHLWYAVKVTREPLFLFSREYLLGDYTIPQSIMAFVYLFTGDILLSSQLVALLYAMVGIVFMYLLGTELKNKYAGILAAALLAFNHLFWFYSSRPLADSPLLVTTIILLYCIVRLEKENSLKWSILTGVMFVAVMLTKVQAMTFTLALLIYYLLFKRKKMFTEKNILYSWLIPASLLLIAQVVGTFAFHTGILNRVFQLFLDQRGMPFGFEAFKMVQWIFSWHLLVLAGLGAGCVLFYKTKNYYFPIILFLFYYLFFEINVDNTQDRYVLPLLSIGIILAIFALDEIYQFGSLFINRKIAFFIPLLIVSLIAWNYYQTGEALNHGKSFTYTGYQEAGQWIKDNVPPDAPIFAGEYRSIRAFADREFGGPPGPPSEDYGGTVWNLRSPYRYTEENTAVGSRNFEEDVKMLTQESDVYLEVDIWEYAQPSWYWPLSQKSFNYFSSLGFKVVHIVEREIQTKDGPKKVPVIFILKKEKNSVELKIISP